MILWVSHDVQHGARVDGLAATCAKSSMTRETGQKVLRIFLGLGKNMTW